MEVLENRGVFVQSISPLALLALQHHGRLSHRNDAHLVLWGDGQHVELFRMRDGKLAAWQVLPASRDSLAQWLAVEALAETQPVVVLPLHLSPDLLELLSALPDVRMKEPAEEPLLDAALAAARDVLSGKERLWVELRRDALGIRDAYRPIRGSLRLVAVAAGVFLMALSGALLLCAHRYEQCARRDEAAQAAIFAKFFGAKRFPPESALGCKANAPRWPA